MMKFYRFAGFLVASALFGSAACGGSISAVEETNIAADLAAHGKKPVEDTAPEDKIAVTQIASVTRAELDAIIAKGPPYLLARIQLDPVFENSVFVGWELAGYRSELQSVLGLAPGDIIMQINDLPIERPEQIEVLYQQLKTAAQIVFDVRRGGRRIQLVSPILPASSPTNP
jgi:type II secretory pathway component PulC